MRLLKPAIAALALTAFAILPANACSWHKSAKAEEKMSVAETIAVPEVDTDVSTATNDLTDELLEGTVVLPVPGEEPAE